jgi:uncharacterized cupin superfamily protein
MPNIYEALEPTNDGVSAARVGESAGSDKLGMSVYELQPGQGMVFHYHLQREELLIVLRGTVALRTAAGWEELAEGDVAAFPRGERGAHGYENRSAQPARVVMICDQNAPNVSVYPDTDEIGIFDAPRRADRRFGALFKVSDARSGYGGGEAEIVSPVPPTP